MPATNQDTISPAVRLQLERRAEERGMPVEELVETLLREAVRRAALPGAVSVTSSGVSVTAAG